MGRSLGRPGTLRKSGAPGGQSAFRAYFVGVSNYFLVHTKKGLASRARRAYNGRAMKNKHVGQYFVELDGPELTVYRCEVVVLTGVVVDGAIVEVTYGDEIPAGVETAVEELCEAT